MDSTQNKVTQFIGFVQSKRWLFFILAITFVLLCSAGLKNLKFSSDYRVLFDKSNSYLLNFEAYEHTFDKTDNVFIAIEFDQGSVFSAERLEIVRAFTERLWQVPHAVRVDSLANFQHTVVAGDDINVRPLVEEGIQLTGADVSEIENIALNEDSLVNRLVSPDGKAAAFYVTQNLAEDATAEVAETLVFVHALEREYVETYPDMKIYVSGLTALSGAFVESTKRDLSRLTPLLILSSIILVGIVLRSFLASVTAILVSALSTMSALGFAGWLSMTLSPPTMATINILLTLTIATVVHVLLNAQQYRHEKEISFNEAMKESFGLNALPIGLTIFTTAIGFLSLNFSASPPFRDLGNIVSFGLFVLLVLSFTFMPALMTFTSSKAKKPFINFDSITTGLVNFVIRNYRQVVIVIGLVFVGVAYFAPKNIVNDRYSEYFDHSIPFRDASDNVARYFPALYSIEFEMKSAGKDGISDPEYLEGIDKFSDWLKQHDKVSNVLTITGVVKTLNQNMHNGDEEFYRIPESKELASQYLLLYELSLPFGLDLNSQISSDRSSTRLIGNLRNISTEDMRNLEADANAWIRNNLPEYMWSDATGPSIMFCHVALNNIKAGIIGGIFALLIISLIISFALRSVKLGLISIIPNAIPIIFTFGLWFFYKGEVGLSLSLVISVSLGILVDDTIHVLSKYRFARSTLGLACREAVHFAYKKVSGALILTTVALGTGFSILANSSFSQSADAGLFITMTLFTALLCDLLLLPALLVLFDSGEEEVKSVSLSGSVLASGVSR